jgi:hypothetical protein
VKVQNVGIKMGIVEGQNPEPELNELWDAMIFFYEKGVVVLSLFAHDNQSSVCSRNCLMWGCVWLTSALVFCLLGLMMNWQHKGKVSLLSAHYRSLSPTVFAAICTWDYKVPFTCPTYKHIMTTNCSYFVHPLCSALWPPLKFQVVSVVDCNLLTFMFVISIFNDWGMCHSCASI